MSTTATLDLISHSATTTRRLGYRLGRRLRAGDVVVLSGDLGAGKTTFAQGIAASLGVAAAVNSPSFTFINEYDAVAADGRPVTLYHVDLYRLERGGVDTIGLDDYLDTADGIGVVEWPEMAPAALPATALVVDIERLTDTKRRLTLRAHGPDAARFADRLAALREELFGAGAH